MSSTWFPQLISKHWLFNPRMVTILNSKSILGLIIHHNFILFKTNHFNKIFKIHPQTPHKTKILQTFHNRCPLKCFPKWPRLYLHLHTISLKITKIFNWPLVACNFKWFLNNLSLKHFKPHSYRFWSKYPKKYNLNKHKITNQTQLKNPPTQTSCCCLIDKRKSLVKERHAGLRDKGGWNKFHWPWRAPGTSTKTSFNSSATSFLYLRENKTKSKSKKKRI